MLKGTRVAATYFVYTVHACDMLSLSQDLLRHNVNNITGQRFASVIEVLVQEMVREATKTRSTCSPQAVAATVTRVSKAKRRQIIDQTGLDISLPLHIATAIGKTSSELDAEGEATIAPAVPPMMRVDTFKAMERHAEEMSTKTHTAATGCHGSEAGGDTKNICRTRSAETLPRVTTVACRTSFVRFLLCYQYR